MTLITALELYNNYPDQISILTAKDETEKFAAFMYRLKGEYVHKIMASTAYVFETSDEAKQYMEDVVKSAIDYVKNLEPTNG